MYPLRWNQDPTPRLDRLPFLGYSSLDCASLLWLAAVGISPLELREGPGGWTERLSMPTSPTGSCLVSLFDFNWPPVSLSSPTVDAVQLLSHVWLSVTLWTAPCQTSLSFTVSWSLLRFMSIESVVLSNNLIFRYSFLLLPSIFPSIRVFFSELGLHIRWPKYWSFSFSISPSKKK